LSPEHEPPLNDRELRIVRGMIDEYESGRIVEAWFAHWWHVLIVVVGALSAGAVLAASLLEIARTFGLVP
jgi:hypothetical protein